MPMEGRKSGNQDYRFSFQGQEKDDEIKGQGNSLNYEYRMHDPRIGRFFAVDPLAAKYAYNSTYAFSENRVMDGVELEGLEWEPINDGEGNIIDYRWIGYRKNENGTLYAQEGTVPGGVIGNTTYSSSGGGPEDLANPIYDFAYGTGYISTSTTRTNENGIEYGTNELIKISGNGIEYSESSTNPEFSFEDQNYSRTFDHDLIRGYKSKSNIESEISAIYKAENHSKFAYPSPGTASPADFEFYSTIAFGISGLKALKWGIGELSIPVFRVYGGGALRFGESWTFVNPKLYGSTYRNFAGLPSENSGAFLMRGSVQIKNISKLQLAKPLDGNFGLLVPELKIGQSWNVIKWSSKSVTKLDIKF